MKRALLLVTLAACGSGSAEAPDAAPPPILFYEQVAPILADNCLRCHVEGGIAPFALVTYEDVVDKADKMVEETAARRMPPYLVTADGSCQSWKNVLRLTDEQIATIAAWVDGGMAMGDPAAAPPLPAPLPRLDDASATYDIGVEYLPNTRLDDDYRCFVIDPGAGIATDKFITAYEFVPGDKRVVHHAILFSMGSDQADGEAMQLEAEDAMPGYTCFGGTRTSSFLAVAAWAPGVPATFYPEGSGLRVKGGHKLVMQVHYNLLNGAYPDRTQVKLKLADTVQREAVVLPIADLGMQLDPGLAEATTTYSVTVPATIPIARVWGVFPHMHLLGRKLNVSVESAAGNQCLVDVKQWSFHWQQFYFYRDPLLIYGGDRVTITCTYDTTERSEVVTWGEGTLDEMCLNGFYVSL